MALVGPDSGAGSGSYPWTDGYHYSHTWSCTSGSPDGWSRSPDSGAQSAAPFPDSAGRGGGSREQLARFPPGICKQHAHKRPQGKLRENVKHLPKYVQNALPKHSKLL